MGYVGPYVYAYLSVYGAIRSLRRWSLDRSFVHRLVARRRYHEKTEKKTVSVFSETPPPSRTKNAFARFLQI